MKILECKKLNIGYADNSICKDISFEVEQGQYVCIIGENGSGKSTLIKTILGLNKPLSGKVVFDEGFNKSCVGYLPQQTDFQKDFPATVKEVILSGFVGRMGFRPFYSRQEKEKARAIINNLNIDTYQHRSYKELSGGQQQRVLLARALCATDELLILDEPTNGLDSRSIARFYDLIARLNRENGLTIIMVTHNLDKVINDVSHIVYLKDTPEFIGTKDDFVANEEYTRLYSSKEVKR